MSRYVTKKHGLIIGSDNWFFYKDETGFHESFKAIVWAKEYTFNRFTTAHVGMRTPAQHMIWQPIHWTVPQTLGEHSWEHPVVGFEPTEYVKRWLNENAPGHGYRKVDKTNRDPERNPSIFFSKRSHALAFVRYIEGLLEGIKIAS